MSTNKWLLLGALAGLAGIAINKQLRLARHRGANRQLEAGGRSSIDDVPTVQPASDGAMSRSTDDTARFDEGVAPGAPF